MKNPFRTQARTIDANRTVGDDLRQIASLSRHKEPEAPRIHTRKSLLESCTIEAEYGKYEYICLRQQVSASLIEEIEKQGIFEVEMPWATADGAKKEFIVKWICFSWRERS